MHDILTANLDLVQPLDELASGVEQSVQCRCQLRDVLIDIKLVDSRSDSSPSDRDLLSEVEGITVTSELVSERTDAPCPRQASSHGLRQHVMGFTSANADVRGAPTSDLLALPPGSLERGFATCSASINHAESVTGAT
jgi:hypothetical protein